MLSVVSLLWSQMFSITDMVPNYLNLPVFPFPVLNPQCQTSEVSVEITSTPLNLNVRAQLFPSHAGIEFLFFYIPLLI